MLLSPLSTTDVNRPPLGIIYSIPKADVHFIVNSWNLDAPNWQRPKKTSPTRQKSHTRWRNPSSRVSHH